LIASSLAQIRRAQQAGAAAVIIVQTAAQWPYQMTDATNASTDGDLAAVFMISKHDGRELVDRIVAQQQQQPRQQSAVSARWGTIERRPFCAICREQFAREECAMRLPCAHPFHAECVRPWLAQRNSCPLCRHEMPTGDADIDARLNQSAAVAAAAGNRDAAYEQLRVSMWG
jgi:hypothetical protein